MNEIRRRARKRHICEHCQQHILPGTLYEYARITPWDHPDNEGYSNYRAHLRCNDLWGEVGEETDWIFGWDPDEWQRRRRTEDLERLQKILPGFALTAGQMGGFLCGPCVVKRDERMACVVMGGAG